MDRREFLKGMLGTVAVVAVAPMAVASIARGQKSSSSLMSNCVIETDKTIVLKDHSVLQNCLIKSSAGQVLTAEGDYITITNNIFENS